MTILYFLGCWTAASIALGLLFGRVVRLGRPL